MIYLCLVYIEEKMRDAMPQAELEAWNRDTLAHAGELRKTGHFLGARTLKSVQTATTLKVRAGKLSLIDGPFAETGEQLAGFILIEARDLNEAIQTAARIPGAKYGSVEVRPVLEPQEETESNHRKARW